MNALSFILFGNTAKQSSIYSLTKNTDSIVSSQQKNTNTHWHFRASMEQIKHFLIIRMLISRASRGHLRGLKRSSFLWRDTAV